MNAQWEYAVTAGDAEAVRRLIRSGLDVDARDRYGQTAVMLAAHRGHTEVLEALIEAGASLDLTAKYNLTALMLAVVARHRAAAHMLARAGADLRIQGSGAPGFSGKTAYDLAVELEMTDLYPDLQA